MRSRILKRRNSRSCGLPGRSRVLLRSVFFELRDDELVVLVLIVEPVVLKSFHFTLSLMTSPLLEEEIMLMLLVRKAR